MIFKGTGGYKDTFSASYARVFDEGTRQRFFDILYDTFLGSSTAAAAKFLHTDLQRQKRMLQKPVVHLGNLYSKRKVPEELSYVAALHSHNQKDIASTVYVLWLNSLISTSRRITLSVMQMSN